MLRNSPILPVPGDLPRQWISDDYFDLIVWYRDEIITDFQLCYGKPYEERALTWFMDDHFSHSRVDGGDDRPTANRTPVLLPGGSFPKDKVISEFDSRSGTLAPGLKNFVLEKLRRCKV